MGFLSPGIGDFFKSGDFYPGHWGFLFPGIVDFYPRDFSQILGIGDFLSLGFFGHGDFSGKFFRGMRYPTKKPPLVKICFISF